MPVLLVSAVARFWKIKKSSRLESFVEELSVYDGEIGNGDPRWSTPLGSHVHVLTS